MSDFTPRILESAGKSIDEAIYKGLSEMGVSIDEVDIEIVRQSTKGVLGIGAKPSIVRLIERDPRALLEEVMPTGSSDWRAESRRAPRADRPPRPEKRRDAPRLEEKPRRESPDTAAEAMPLAETRHGGEHGAGERRGDRGRDLNSRGRRQDPQIRDNTIYHEYVKGESDCKAAEFLAEVLELMGISASVFYGDGNDAQKIKIISESMGVLIGHRGETLDALQYITGLAANRNSESYRRVSIDTENYRSKREETLVRLARKIANQVKATGERVMLEPMNPYERRVLHASLQNNPYVTTCSEGDEPNRRVVVSPKQ